MMTKNMTEPFLESTVSSLMEAVYLYLYILALKKMFCPLFSPIQLIQFPEWI